MPGAGGRRPRPCRRSWVWGLPPLGPWAGPAGGSWAALASLCPPTPPRREPDASLLSTSQRSLLLAKNSPRSGEPARRGEYELLHPLPPRMAEWGSPALGPGVLGSWGAESGLQREVMWPEPRAHSSECGGRRRRRDRRTLCPEAPTQAGSASPCAPHGPSKGQWRSQPCPSPAPLPPGLSQRGVGVGWGWDGAPTNLHALRRLSGSR